MPNYFEIGQGNQWLRPVSATYDFRMSHGTANSAHCTASTALPWIQRTVNCDALAPGIFLNTVFTSAPWSSKNKHSVITSPGMAAVTC